MDINTGVLSFFSVNISIGNVSGKIIELVERGSMGTEHIIYK